MIIGQKMPAANISFAQINNFEDERNYLYALQALVEQSYSAQFNETIGTIQEDPDEANRQWLTFDPMSMNLVYYKTPYDKDDDGKNVSEIIWKAKFVIPLYEVDAISFKQKKNTMTIKMKGNKPSIQSYMIMSGNEYYLATKNEEVNIPSDKVSKIRNITHRLNWHISELQNFHQKKLDLVDYLNKKLQKEVEYQTKDSLNYPEDRKFKVIQEFQLDNSGQWLSVIVERKNIYDKPLREKQSVMLRDVLKVGKDITVMLVSKAHNVLKTTTVKNDGEEERKIETVDEWFYLHYSHEKDNEKLRDEIIKLFKQIGQDIQKSD